MPRTEILLDCGASPALPLPCHLSFLRPGEPPLPCRLRKEPKRCLGSPMDLLWVSYGFAMALLWFCYSFTMGLLWICYTFAIVLL